MHSHSRQTTRVAEGTATTEAAITEDLGRGLGKDISRLHVR
jgi:hypothetical protein